MKLIAEIVALPGWNTPMLMLLAKTTLILVAALGITVTMQRASAGARHLVWLITLGALLLVPALATFTPLRLEILPAASDAANSPAAKTLSIPATSASIQDPTASSPIGAVNAGAQSRVSNPVSATPVARRSMLAMMSGFSILITIWAAIVLAIAAWLAYGTLMVRRIVRHSHPLDTQDWLTPLYEVADRLELENPPRLLSSSDAKMPFACGFLTPTIVLPAECESWSEDRRRAVLLHELAHVRRHDLAGHTLGRLACAVYWFHPLVWTAAKQLRNESERACDDLALSCGARASDYAEHLLDIVTSVRHDSTPAVALAMARRKEFEGRMLAILDPELRHAGPSKWQSATLIGSLALITIVVGAAAPAHRSDRVAKARAPVIETSMTQAPADFTPRDLPEREPRKLDNGKLDKSTLENIIDHTVEKTAQRTIQQTTTNTVTNTVMNSVQSAVSSLDIGGIAAKALAQVGNLNFKGAKGDKGNGSTDDRPALLANVLRTDTSATLRRTAAWGLSEYADDQIAVDALAKAVRSDPDASVREMAAWALANGNDKDATATGALTAALRSDGKEQVRVTAAWALGNVGGRDAVEPLTAALADASASVRMRAVWALGSVEPHSAPPALIATLKDRDPQIRELAAWALYEIEDPSAAPALNAALSTETDKRLQIAYIRALAALGEKSVDAVRGLLTSSDPRIKSMAVRALAGGNAAGPWPWPWPEPRPYP